MGERKQSRAANKIVLEFRMKYLKVESFTSGSKAGED